MIYYFLPTLSFLGSLSNYKKNWTIKVLFYWILLLLFILLMGMYRGENIGTDYLTYKDIFQHNVDTEIGISFLMNLTRKCGFHFFLATIFLISFFLKWESFKLGSLDPFLSLTLYLGFWFLVYDLNGIRQGLALSFCGLSVVSCMKNLAKKWIFFLVGLGICCHYSMVLFIPFIYLYKRKYHVTKMCLIAAFIFVISYLGIPIKMINFITGDSGYLILKAVSYSNNESYNANVTLSFSTIHRFAIFLAICYFIPRMELSRSIKSIYIWGSFLNICTYLLLSNIEIVATRGSLYFRYIELFSLAAIPYCFKKKSSRVVAKFILYFYVIWQIQSTLSIPNGNLLPYHFLDI